MEMTPWIEFLVLGMHGSQIRAKINKILNFAYKFKKNALCSENEFSHKATIDGTSLLRIKNKVEHLKFFGHVEIIRNRSQLPPLLAYILKLVNRKAAAEGI